MLLLNMMLYWMGSGRTPLSWEPHDVQTPDFYQP